MGSISENILSLICWLGIFQGILLSAVIYFHPKSDKSVNTFLALHILFLTLVSTMPFFLKIISWKNSYFVQALPFLVGPFLYLYLRSFKERITWRKALPHFAAYLIFILLAYYNISSLARKHPNVSVVGAEILRNPLTIVLMYVRLVHLLFYYYLARKTLIFYQRSIEHLFSDTSRFNLKWARILINGYLCLVLISMVVIPLMIRFPEHFNLLFLADMAIAAPYLYFASIKAVGQPTLWQAQANITKEEVEKEIQDAEKIEVEIVKSEKSKSQKVGLSESRITELLEKITILMEAEKLYQEPELTIQQLAGRLEVPIYQASQALNDGFKKNFYDLVNSYRVEEAKLLLLDPKNKNFTVLSIGFEAGFNSKTTFNTVFKKLTGLTPTEYRSRHGQLTAST